MDILESLEREHSKKLTAKIVDYVGHNKSRFKVLMRLFLKGDVSVSQRAAWPLSYIVIAKPSLISRYYPQLLEKLKDKNLHPAIHRNILRTFESIDIPEKYQSALFDLSLGFITSEHHPIAVRAFSITIACNIAKPYTELTSEITIVLHELNRHTQSPAIRARIKQGLQILAR